MNLKEEFAVKQARVREYLAKKKLDGVLLTRQDNFAWMTCGGSNFVGIASEMGVASILFLPPRKYIIANNIEMPRMLAEEVGKLGFKPLSFPWHRDEKKAQILERLLSNKKVASDTPVAGTKPLDADFAALRFSLTAAEVARYKALGRDCSEAMEEVCPKIKKGQREYEVAAAICSAFLARNIIPTVVLIAADDRINKFRHPIFTNKRIRKRVMVVMCGRRKGLIVSLTRLVHFGKLPPELKRKHQAVANVDAAYILSSKVGARLGDVLAAGIKAYKDAGFGDEWKLHHQGGPTGYAGRDIKVTPGETRKIVANQALAWNPSITGTKSEDTIIATDRKPIVLSAPRNFPTITAEFNGQKIERADILVL